MKRIIWAQKLCLYLQDTSFSDKDGATPWCGARGWDLAVSQLLLGTGLREPQEPPLSCSAGRSGTRTRKHECTYVCVQAMALTAAGQSPAPGGQALRVLPPCGPSPHLPALHLSKGHPHQAQSWQADSLGPPLARASSPTLSPGLLPCLLICFAFLWFWSLPALSRGLCYESCCGLPAGTHMPPHLSLSGLSYLLPR